MATKNTGFSSGNLTLPSINSNSAIGASARDVADIGNSARIGVTHDVTPESNVMLGDKGADTSLSPSIIAHIGGVQALYSESRDTIYLVADSLNKENTIPVLMHELMHRLEATDPSLRRAIEKFDNNLRERLALAVKGEGTDIENAAAERVMQAWTDVEDQLSEFKSYIVEIYNKKPDSFTGVLKKIFQDFIASIRMALLRAGISPSSLTPADLNALAKQGAKVNQVSAKDTLGAQSKLKEIRNKIDAYEKFIKCLAA
jgi:hypothetical protein